MELLQRHFRGKLTKGRFNWFDNFFGEFNEDRNESLKDFLNNLIQEFNGKTAQINILVTIED